MTTNIKPRTDAGDDSQRTGNLEGNTMNARTASQINRLRPKTPPTALRRLTAQMVVEAVNKQARQLAAKKLEATR